MHNNAFDRNNYNVYQRFFCARYLYTFNDNNNENCLVLKKKTILLTLKFNDIIERLSLTFTYFYFKFFYSKIN